MLQPITTFLNEQETREPCLIEPDMLPFNGKMFLYGQAGVMKSMLVLQMCYEVACGLPWLGQFPTTESKVVYLQCELPKSKFRDRVRVMAGGYPLLSPDRLWVCSSKTMKVAPNDAEFRTFIRELKEIKPALWVIDPQYKVLVGDENSGTDMQRLYDLLDRLADEVGCATVIVAHSRNTRFGDDGTKIDLGFQEISGSHRQQDWGDIVCRLQRTRRGKVLKFEKMRYDELPEALELEFHAETLTHTVSGGDELAAKIRGILMEGEQEQGQFIEMLVGLGFAGITVRRRLDKMEAEGELAKVEVQGDRRKKMLRLRRA